jgi:hypothetical protein
MRDGAAVALPNDLLIGLDVGAASIEAAAFAPDVNRSRVSLRRQQARGRLPATASSRTSAKPGGQPRRCSARWARWCLT